MKKSKLLRALETLDAKELARFQLFIQSPYFHRPKVTPEEIQLLDLLEGHFPDFAAAPLTKERVFSQLYPGRTYVSGQLEKKMTALLKRLEHFIAQETLTKSNLDVQQELAVAQFYHQRGQRQLHESKLMRLQQQIKKKSVKAPKDLYDAFLVDERIANYQSMYNRRKDEDLHLFELLAALDNFYFTARMEYTCDLLFQSEVHSTFDLQDFLLVPETLKDLILKVDYLEGPLIWIYRQMFILLQQMEGRGMEQVKDFEELERLLNLYEHELPLLYRKNFHTFCRSIYTFQFNAGRMDLQKKIFTLYQNDLEKGYLFFHGGIKSSAFANIVAFGLREKEYDWVFQFLQKYRDKIAGTQYPEEVYQFNLAQYHFAQKAYKAAKDCLANSYEDLYYQINAKKLELKILFEEESVLFDAKLDAFRLFLRRLSKKNLPEPVRVAINNFINILKQIRMPETYNNPQRIEKIRTKIKTTSAIKDREWLLQKLT